jgi:hypothetical protein
MNPKDDRDPPVTDFVANIPHDNDRTMSTEAHPVMMTDLVSSRNIDMVVETDRVEVTFLLLLDLQTHRTF